MRYLVPLSSLSILCTIQLGIKVFAISFSNAQQDWREEKPKAALGVYHRGRDVCCAACWLTKKVLRFTFVTTNAVKR